MRASQFKDACDNLTIVLREAEGYDCNQKKIQNIHWKEKSDPAQLK